jgi:hypothetical protein
MREARARRTCGACAIGAFDAMCIGDVPAQFLRLRVRARRSTSHVRSVICATSSSVPEGVNIEAARDGSTTPYTHATASPATVDRTLGLAAALRELNEAREELESARAVIRQTRRRVEAIDELLAELEDRNLSGDRRRDRSLAQRLVSVQREVGIPLPRKVIRARNTARLHSALLDWQESVLYEVAPLRTLMSDLDDDCEQPAEDRCQVGRENDAHLGLMPD